MPLLVWLLLSSGVVQGIVAEGMDHGVHWVSGSGPGPKRIRLNRKNPCTPRGFRGPISVTCMEEVESCEVCISLYS